MSLNKITVSQETVWLNNNLMSALNDLNIRLTYLTYMVDSMIEAQGYSFLEQVDKLTCKKVYFDKLTVKDHNESTDLQVRDAIQKDVESMRQRIVDKYGEDFVASIEFEYHQKKKEDDPAWSKKHLIKI